MGVYSIFPIPSLPSSLLRVRSVSEFPLRTLPLLDFIGSFRCVCRRVFNGSFTLVLLVRDGFPTGGKEAELWFLFPEVLACISEECGWLWLVPWRHGHRIV